MKNRFIYFRSKEREQREGKIHLMTAKLLLELSCIVQKCSYNNRFQSAKNTHYQIIQITPMEKSRAQPKLLQKKSGVEEFYALGVRHYQEQIAESIRLHLISSLQGESEETKNYSKETNQELTRRGYFLSIFFEQMCVIKTVSNHLTNLQQKPISVLPFRKWLETLILSINDLTQINKQKQEAKTAVPNLTQRLILLLYQTQIFVFQILIRIYLHQEITEAREKYEDQLNQLQRRYHCLLEDQEVQGQGREGSSALSKSQKRRRKTLYKEINQIINFYQCQISITRVDCTVKPEIEYLFDLLKQKISQHIFKDLLEKTYLGDLYQNLNIAVKAHNFSPFIIVPIKNQDKVPETDKIKRLSLEKLQSFCFQTQKETVVQVNKKEQETKQKQKNGSASHTFSPQAYSSPPERRKQEYKQSTQKRESESAKKIKSLHKRMQRQSTPMAHLSSQQKLQFIGFNQRFSQNVCNLTKRLVKVKKDRDLEDDSKSSSKPPAEYIQSTREVFYCPANWEDFSENVMVLAEETPIIKKEPLQPEQ